MNERQRIRKLHERAIGAQFISWIAERGGLQFSLFSQPLLEASQVPRRADQGKPSHAQPAQSAQYGLSALARHQHDEST